eukprot:scaffold41970_cov43-Phaeocystis_antarctica.AAC.1
MWTVGARDACSFGFEQCVAYLEEQHGKGGGALGALLPPLGLELGQHLGVRVRLRLRLRVLELGPHECRGGEGARAREAKGQDGRRENGPHLDGQRQWNRRQPHHELPLGAEAVGARLQNAWSSPGPEPCVPGGPASRLRCR